MQKTIAIIGAGVAGLSAGCYLQMNGYQTAIYEMEDTPGGLCTSWKRGGYRFDGSVAGLAGSAPGNPLYQLWQELGVIKYCPLHFGENFGHICLPEGKIVTVYADIDKFETHLLGLFPDEEKVIFQFTNAIRSVLSIDPPFNSSQGFEGVRAGIIGAIKMVRNLPALTKYSKMTIREFSAKFQDPSLSTVINNLVHFGGPDVPVLTVLLPLAYAHRRMAGIPTLGWLDFAKAIEKRYLELGGKVNYRSRVRRIVLEGSTAKGIILENGREIKSDLVLSAADGRFSNFIILGENPPLKHNRFQPQLVSDQPVQVNLGVNDDFSNLDGPVTYLLTEPFEAAGQQHSRITVHNKYYDPSCAPVGKSALTVFLDSSYQWWQQCKQNGCYEHEKSMVAREIINTISTFRPGFAEKVEVIDVSTPLTRERYTGNWLGAMQAFKPNANLMAALLRGGSQYEFRKVRNYFMAGQWVESWGGITTAAQSGRNAALAICKRDRKKFSSKAV